MFNTTRRSSRFVWLVFTANVGNHSKRYNVRTSSLLNLRMCARICRRFRLKVARCLHWLWWLLLTTYPRCTIINLPWSNIMMLSQLHYDDIYSVTIGIFQFQLIPRSTVDNEWRCILLRFPKLNILGIHFRKRILFQYMFLPVCSPHNVVRCIQNRSELRAGDGRWFVRHAGTDNTGQGKLRTVCCRLSWAMYIRLSEAGRHTKDAADFQWRSLCQIHDFVLCLLVCWSSLRSFSA